ncbi:hypothetical protein [Brevibacterium sp. SMBL_HHYL_HB1]|uniref:hypothetical protein n=1 Tax=Brevibacterium sp. SMBL_HHYL_HB1 TaxID=2777556 RepID=UPI001BA7DA45|nr:hypothetical protein [Brevibacterium sp. SMBL_HHYL_HB1]QUL77859.1 hypothetical protein IG171_10090 [Brevibacterium sp. SMBL_HHYL_HB1]
MEQTQSPHLALVPDVFDAVIKGIDYSDNRGWIPWAWAALVRAGDVPEQLDESDEDYAAHVITLVALGYLYERFQDVYAGTEGDDELMIEVLGSDRPFITDIDVARYCERHGYASLEDPETGPGLLQEAAKNRRVEVKARLRELLGDGRLFTSLVISGIPEPEPEYDEDGREIETPRPGDPLAENAFDDQFAGVTSDLSNAEAYEWLTR